jgi:hypothetical protein
MFLKTVAFITLNPKYHTVVELPIIETNKWGLLFLNQVRI